MSLDIATFLSEHKVWLISASILTVVGVVLIGIPGATLMEFVLDPLVEFAIAGPLEWEKPHGDTTWPLAIGYTIFLPWVCFAVYLGIEKTALANAKPWNAIAIAAIAFAIFALAHTLYRFSNRV